jgi:hypothetical protein
VRRRFAPHQLRHAHAVELAREDVPLNVIQCQLAHANLGTTSVYLQRIDTEEIIATVHADLKDRRRERPGAPARPGPSRRPCPDPPHARASSDALAFRSGGASAATRRKEA